MDKLTTQYRSHARQPRVELADSPLNGDKGHKFESFYATPAPRVQSAAGRTRRFDQKR